ncbi:outer membrane beta-barrel protein [Pseudoalteromonas sp. S16_S37]|uniref:outer membrane beta-barrel protein n=1 Tax=Pseudoalteromonas sp. S16_S37 TaxID=2720228 RepID=UPI00168077A0|nr:outer membrane beta-barrel protein [Pseudoalteromonas sp. S16_S37]MBD1582566.1 porin family protein [Pseudoalteromonas sp. S16_S37]
MKIRSIISLVLLNTVSFTSLAEQQDETHRLGAQLQGGSAEYKNSSQDGDGVGSVYLYYNYQFDSTWALELGVNRAREADDWDCKDITKNKFICNRNDALLFNLDANKLDYNNFVVAAKGQYQVTDNSYFYGKLGAQRYDYEIAKNSKVVAQNDGVGLFAEAGWQYDWSNGFAFNVGWQYMDMGDLDTSSLAIGGSYRF